MNDLVQNDLHVVKQKIGDHLNNSHEPLSDTARYYFDQKGKSIRPIVMLLMAKALSKKLPKSDPHHGLINDQQYTLAMIAEMIHTSSLVHDDVIDEADTRRKTPSANKKFGDPLAIYAGDFILAKASMALAGLNNLDLITTIATIIDDLVDGELKQLSNEAKASHKVRFDHYLTKTYLKTASLFANGCLSVATASKMDEQTCESSRSFGHDLGMAFQVIDDVLDLVSTSEELGKPSSADLSLGLATAPILYAAEEFPELNPLIKRRFKGPGDVPEALHYLNKSSGLARSRELAAEYGQSAVRTIQQLPESLERQALVDLCALVLSRSS
ncbi:hypothetical protein SARC_08652 [Sphaeroforma arctica JP610]|uniref:Uncharacterized protein n=1 Tax=Sphaeroforma arctica JP610 TaxID=667725 RepID=A0A0L0FQV5_9EUKA|nr:hypothetical protein SARC_08652 [Sphaeroforma arctica JP610]KNC78931.1 hypothetical protein SARC_08652 [Sphaeroforma arctica JP610]|eukprot:XP_014152833.1 hypothetical protein SARC_08652 [Sphaeroforma arctica JP610]